MSKLVLSVGILLTLIVVSLGEDRDFPYDSIFFSVFALILLSIGAYFFIRVYLRTTEGMIFLMERKLKKQILRNSGELEVLKNKISAMNDKMFAAKEVDSDVKGIVLDNIDLWTAQIDIHRRIIILCENKISKLAQNRREIRLLKELLKQVEGEPNSSDKIDELQKLLHDIDLKLNDKIDKDIRDLVSSIKTDSRRSNIVKMHKKLMNIEREAV